jgi:hypothetical protein
MPLVAGIRRGVLAFGFVLVCPVAVAAQAGADSAPSAPYSRLRLRVGAARSVDHEPVDGYYRAATGGAFGITTPFYLGWIGITGAFMPLNALDHNVAAGRPNLHMLLLAVDWGVDLPLHGPLRARASADLGDFVMIIENPETRFDSESELFTGASLSAGYALRRDLTVVATGFLARVHTRPALNLGIVTLGLEYATRTPRWLRAILE